jgi:GH25 family lysozyme M1 (1,4-beta-N-acetylmuramidase)
MTILATGLDISSNQHPKNARIDWRAARAAGWSWVAIKATEGATYTNPYFTGQYGACQRDPDDARAAGFTVDTYHWVSPTSAASAQVTNVLRALAKAAFTPASGRVWLDFEQDGATHATLDAIRAGLRAAGYPTGTYTYPNFWKTHGDHACAECAADPLWFAWTFPEEPTPQAVTERDFTIAPWPAVTIWQYAGTSLTIPGIPGRNDGNRILRPLPTLDPATTRRYRMLVFAQGLDATTALAVCAARRTGVATTSLDEAKAAIARGEQVIVIGGPAAAALGLQAPVGTPTAIGPATVAIGATADDTLTLATQLIH